MQFESHFWQKKSLLEMTESEWEALCDGCGKCCYRKYIQGRGKSEKLYYTRIACNLLDVETGKCCNYPERFKIESDCTKLTKKNLPDFGWLPNTCAYRLLYEGKPLPKWHPLVSGDPNSVKKAGVLIQDGVHEEDVIDWFEFVIETE
ncbi:YcgN family cysteine cluster protein [uncultured Haemophilus sp.]|uniref:YcgN family cysteine cluster protein n=1 Tax=uncultured Haemophilus sp. TaxID=237779 RepID=UPI002586E7F6|nr:YcgN family cysteine cluster protein [uncultured Haemophilus sp.]